MNANVVNTNAIVLEGVSLYIVLAIMLLMMISICALAYSGIGLEEKNDRLQSELDEEREKNASLEILYNKATLRRRIKYGELEPDSERSQRGV